MIFSLNLVPPLFIFLKKNLNASKPSQHPPQVEEECLTYGRWTPTCQVNNHSCCCCCNVAILTVVTKDLRISPRCSCYDYLSRCSKFKALLQLVNQSMVEFCLLMHHVLTLSVTEETAEYKFLFSKVESNYCIARLLHYHYYCIIVLIV